MQSAHLKLVLEGGALLAGSARVEGATKLEDVLRNRLTQYYKHLGRERTSSYPSTLEELQVETAHESLSVIEQVQQHLSGKLPQEQNATGEAHEEELIGTRDLAQIRILLSLIFKWAVEPLLGRVCASLPATVPGGRRRNEVNIIDLTTVPDDFQRLKDTITCLIHLILPQGTQGVPNATVLSSVILDKHMADLLRPSIVLGWMPKTLASESVYPVDDLRPVVVRLMLMLPVSKCITALSVLLSEPSIPPYVRRSSKYLMSRQLLRRDGLRGLFIALFSDDESSGEDASLERMENAAKVLQTVPTGIDPAEYFSIIVPQLLSSLSPEVEIPSSHRRAAAFTLSRLLSSENNANRTVVSRIVLPAFHRPFLLVVPREAQTEDGSSASSAEMSPTSALGTLQTFLTNTDPSPIIISEVLTPIIPSVYSLWFSLEKIKSADPAMKTTLKGLLGTWGRLIGEAEATAALWLIVDGEGGDWETTVAGEVRRVESVDNGSLSLFTPDDLRRAQDSGELDVDANILDLRPDPLHFAGFLRSLDSPEVVSNIFVRLLEAYRECKASADSDPLRTLLYLQLVVQIQNQLSSSDASVNIFKKPDHILSFIKHALESARSQLQPVKPSSPRHQQKGLGLEDLKIVGAEEEEADGLSDGDSDDEDDGTSRGEGDDEMTATSVNLLLSILEANPDLSTENAPILNDIFPLLEKLAKEGTEDLKTIAREARIVLIARLASSSAPANSRLKETADRESSTETYQKALKLLQDPLLPVRAHGLLLLRQLVTARQAPRKDGQLTEPVIDRALIPGILSIFLQSLQDDDSYIFLNAVQGLSAMVDGFGKEVLKGLVDMYAKNLDGIGAGTLTQSDVDVRTRLGEALGQVIRRCDSALPKYIDQIAPPLIAVMRSAHLPTALRTSAVSLLAHCTNTSPLAVLPWATDLFVAMIDLLQLESTPTQPQRVKAEPTPSQDVPAEDPETPSRTNRSQKLDSTDFKPTSKDPKIPIFRRSALHLLSLLTRTFVAQVDDPGSRSIYILPAETMRRAKITVGYVAATDEDGVVRVMAREASEGLDALAEAMLEL